MSYFSLKPKLAVVCLVFSSLSGCAIWQEPEPSAAELCRRLAVPNNEEGGSVFDTVMASPNREEKLKEFFSGWGRRGDTYDTYVRTALSGSAYPDTMLLEAVNSRLREDPTLILRVHPPQMASADELERAQKFETNADHPVVDLSDSLIKRDSLWRMELIYQSYFSRMSFARSHPTKEGKFAALIAVASMFNRPELILNLTENTIDGQWATEKVWLRLYARYVYFDDQLGYYVFDADAARRNEPVAPERQWPHEGDDVVK